MTSISIVLPDKVLEVLKRKAEFNSKTIEELIGEAVFERLKITDPEVKAELHLKLCKKYMDEAKQLLARKDYVQASEKAWGAASQMIKAIAAKEGKELGSHTSMWEYASKIAEELKDPELRYLWRTANSLRQNFYENWMPPEEVELSVKDVEKFIEKLKMKAGI